MKTNNYTLTAQDWKRIGQNVLLFNIPTFALIFLAEYAQGSDIKESIITASISFLTAFIDMARKFVGNGESEGEK